MLIFIYLAITIGFIIFATAKYNIHPFLTLIAASLAMGLMGGLDTETIIKSLSGYIELDGLPKVHDEFI